MTTSLNSADQSHLTHAIALSRHALENEGKTPFGAVITINDEIIAEGTSSVVELRDPTAHAEVMALRDAGRKLGRHLMPDAIMYASSEPCPMCLIACYWAQIPRLVFGATSHDVATYGFEDLQLYRELTHPAERRTLTEVSASGPVQTSAVQVLREWADSLPSAVEAKY